MTAPPGLLDFFVLEASEYLEQLDGLLAGGAATPDADALQKSARALRGSATMAKLVAFAELAGAVERLSRAVRDGKRSWDREVGSAMVSAVDELKILLHAARTWSENESARARRHTAELHALLPSGAADSATPGTAGSISFLANETANVAAGLEFVLTAPGGGGDAGAQVLQRIRALRGIAAIRDVPSLPETLEAAEQAAAPLEIGRAIGGEQRAVLTHAAGLLRELAQAVRAGRSVGSERVAELEQALDHWLDLEEGAGAPIVPIDSLFHADGGPHVVTATPNPPTTAPERFRLEIVSLGEHLRLLVDEARTADPGARERYRRHVRRALRGIRRAAASFGERDVADAVEAMAQEITTIDDAALARLTAAARHLAAPAGGSADLAAQLRTPSAAPADAVPEAPIAPAAEAAPPAEAMAPVAMPTPVMPIETVPAMPRRGEELAPHRMTPPVTNLASMLEQSALAVNAVAAAPIAPPIPLGGLPVVPIDALVYRGKAALRRALELRDELRETGGTPDRAAVEELFDLIELALVD